MPVTSDTSPVVFFFFNARKEKSARRHHPPPSYLHPLSSFRALKNRRRLGTSQPLISVITHQKGSLTTTTHHRQSSYINHNHQPSLSITCHYSPSVNIIHNHLPSLAITYHHLSSFSITSIIYRHYNRHLCTKLKPLRKLILKKIQV